MRHDRSNFSRWTAILAAVVSLAVSITAAPAQDPAPASRPGASRTAASELGVRQKRIERMMEEVERKFRALARVIGETEPDQAERLVKAYDAARSLLLHERMGEIAKLLDRSQLDSAVGGQGEVLGDLRKLLSMLLDEREDREKTLEEYEQLEKMRADIEDLLREEREQKRDADKVADKEKSLRDLAAQIKAVEELVRKQREVNEATQAARTAAAKLTPVARQQGDVKDETEKTADEIAGEDADEAKKPEDEPEKGPEPSADESEEKQAAAEKAAKKAAQRERTRPRSPAEQALRDAAKAQKSAEDKLDRGKSRSAADDQEKAVEDLEKALAELRKEQDRLAAMPPEELDAMADKQSDTAAKTSQMQEEMQQNSPPAGEGKPLPGSESVGKAKKNMQNAAAKLGEQDPASASKSQSKAIEDLEEALEDIEERMDELEEDTQSEKRERLLAVFTEMLARQMEASRKTKAVEGTRGPDGELTRVNALPIGNISAEERALAESAHEAYDLVVEEDASVVFPEVIAHLRTDLTNVAELLDAFKTDAYVQSQQREIETTLEELIESLEKATSDKEGGGGGGGGGGGRPPPLVAPSAELKLLKFSQLRVNRRTDAFDKTRPAGKLEAVLEAEVENISRRQAYVADMTLRIIERQEEGR